MIKKYSAPELRVFTVHCGPIALSFNDTDRTEVMGRDDEDDI